MKQNEQNYENNFTANKTFIYGSFCGEGPRSNATDAPQP
jgi:hypothetical protein